MPYHVYGGLQDNSSWVGASQYPGGITNHQWENMYGGDGFWMFADPSDPDYLYGRASGRRDRPRQPQDARNAQYQAAAQYKEGKLRYNWNTPIHLSRLNAALSTSALNFCSGRATRQTWERISPDLTTNDRKTKTRGIGGVTIDNSAAEMPHHDLLHIGIAQEPQRHLGRHG